MIDLGASRVYLNSIATSGAKTFFLGIILTLYRHLIWVLSILMIAQTQSFAGQLDLGYDSKYISEGRDNLPEGGIIWTSLNQELNSDFSFVLAYGVATESMVNYDELNVTIQYAGQTPELSYVVSYTRLEFFADQQSDNELGLAVEWSNLSYVTPSVNLVYSTEAGGAFLALGIGQDYAISDVVNIRPYVSVAFDFGYASKQFNGHNHSSMGAVLAVQMMKNLVFSFITEHNIGARIVKKEIENNHNQTWAGAHLTYSY